MAELSPGSTPRRWAPDGGERKLRERIHRESKWADDNLNLPFKFSKPQKSKKSDYFECVECGRVLLASTNTIMCVCPDCKKVTKVVRITNEELACLDSRPE